MTIHRTYKVTMVSRELSQPLKRLALIHPMTPTLATGGFNSSAGVF
jgi:hypothetical protein